MTDKSSLLLIPILGIVVALSLAISNANAIAVNNTDFSIDVPNLWVYREDLSNNMVVLSPNEFAGLLIEDTPSSLPPDDLQYGGVMAILAPDLDFPIKNAPVEMYLKQKWSKSALPIENATVGGERAVKLRNNGTDLANIVGIMYVAMHNDHPYILSYYASVKDYQKYLPQFEQIVKTFKFTK